MSRLTRCRLSRSSRAFLRPMTLFRLMLLLMFICGLSLAHIQLRFRTRDLQLEIHHLQRERSELKDRGKRLISEVENLKDFEHLRSYAELDLGLQLCPADHSRKAVISADAFERWQGLGFGLEEGSLPEANESVLVSVGERLISWSSVSLARDSSQQRR